MSANREARASGILEDLHDQAEWSSYGQDTPRLGNPRRDAIWWSRGIRFFRGVRTVAQNRELRRKAWWVALGTAILVFIAMVAAAYWIITALRSA
jgi:hypothetical protein